MDGVLREEPPDPLKIFPELVDPIRAVITSLSRGFSNGKPVLWPHP